MGSDSYRIACILISNIRNASDVKERIALLIDCVTSAVEEKSKAIVLPAGFFSTTSLYERNRVATQVLDVFRDRDVIVAFGIDVLDKKRGIDCSFGYLAEKNCYLLGPVAQFGVRTNDVDSETAARKISDRVHLSKLLGRQVCLTLCGEVLSQEWRGALGKVAPDLILHPAHASIPLGGRPPRGWNDKVNNLLSLLPPSSVWAFADHSRAQGHWDGKGLLVSLARWGSTGRTLALMNDSGVGDDDLGWMYVYETT